MNYNSYAVFDGETMRIEFFENKEGRIFGNNTANEYQPTDSNREIH